MADATWLLFTIVSLVPIVMPRPDMVLARSRPVARGAGAGIFTAAGVRVDHAGRTPLATLGAVLRGLGLRLAPEPRP